MAAQLCQRHRALRAFIDEGSITKIAHGLFAKAEHMTFPGREMQAVLTEPFETVAIAALDKLGVKWELGSAVESTRLSEI